MSYIRGALPFLIYNPNTRDDIVPNGVSATFELSQEVPGGYESNVEVIRRELKSDPLIQDCDEISFDGTANKLVCSNPAIAAALSILSAGESINVSGAAESGNNGDLLVSSVVYNGASVEIFVENALTDEAAGELITLIRLYVGSWEQLEAEVDYTISGENEQFNRLINFAKVPQEEDVIYVIHRGEATYNFRPSERSVGPESLQENLRNFVVDHFEGDGSEDTFNLSQFAVNAKTLEVSVDGLIKSGTDVDQSFVGDFELSVDGLSIVFASAPANGAKIQVRHLGFSTVTRRQALSPSQVGSIAPGAVGTPQLANNAVTEQKVDDGAISKFKIAVGAVDGSRILLLNNEWLNWKSGTNPFPAVGVLKIDASDRTTLRSPGGTLSINIADTRLVNISTTAIADGTGTNQIDIGSLSNKFKNAYFAGSVNAASANISGNLDVDGSGDIAGNLVIGGNITIAGEIDNVDISDLQAQVDALAALVAANTPPGTLRLGAADEAPGTGWLDCDGSLYSTTTYAALFAKLGYIYGGSGATFAVPDFRGRFPLGKAASGTGSGMGAGASARSGSLDHTHSTPNHTHGLANHIHNIPAHYHVITPSSTLAIASSGGHTTTIDIAHSHSSSSVSGTIGGLSDTSSNHAHTVSMTTESTNHTHSVAISPGGGHGHQVNAMGRSSGNTSGNPLSWGNAPDDGELALVKGGNGAYDLSTGAFPVADHSHGVSVGNQSQNHNHTLVWVGGGDGRHAHSHSLTAAGQSLGTTNKTDIGGTHIHGPSSFSGAIGPVDTGANGNSAFSSGTPSPNVSDSGGAGTTGGNNPAFQTCRIYIKT